MTSPPIAPPETAAQRARRWAGGAAVALLAVAWAVAAHRAATQPGPSAWGALLALAPVAAAVGLALWSLPQRAGALAGAAAFGLLLVLAWPWMTRSVALLFFLEQTGVYLLLATAFGRTLFGPGESLVTQLARRHEGGQLTPRKQRYTRRVTQAWTVFLVAMAVASAALFLLAPLAVWSRFANLMGGPMIAMMFLAEFLWRRVALAGEPTASLAETWQAWRAHGASQPGTPVKPRSPTEQCRDRR